MWVDGLLAFAPAPFTLLGAGSDRRPAGDRAGARLPRRLRGARAAGRGPRALVDPALAPIDTAARTRIGYRVRRGADRGATCEDGVGGSRPRSRELDGAAHDRPAPARAVPTDPCAPPGDPLGRAPRRAPPRRGARRRHRAAGARSPGRSRTARPRSRSSTVAGDQLTLAPSHLSRSRSATSSRCPGSPAAPTASTTARSTRSTRSRRRAGGDIADARPAGDRAGRRRRARRAPVGRRRSSARRPPATATLPRATDLGDHVHRGRRRRTSPGDWWGARLRVEEGDGIEHRIAAPPDGVRHVFAPARPRRPRRPHRAPRLPADVHPAGRPRPGRGAPAPSRCSRATTCRPPSTACPPGAASSASRPASTSSRRPLLVAERSRIVLTGAGPATILRAQRARGRRGLRPLPARSRSGTCASRAAAPATPRATPTWTGRSPSSRGWTSSSPTASSPARTAPGGPRRASPCARVAGGTQPDRVRVERNRLHVGAWQTGVLIVDAAHATVAGNHLVMPPGPPPPLGAGPSPVLGDEVRRRLGAALRAGKGPGVRTFDVPGSETPAARVLGIGGAPAGAGLRPHRHGGRRAPGRRGREGPGGLRPVDRHRQGPEQALPRLARPPRRRSRARSAPSFRGS